MLKAFQLPIALLIYVLLFLLGNQLAANKDLRTHPTFVSNFKANDSYVSLYIEQPFVEKEKYFKTIARAEKIYFADSSRIVKGKTYLYIKKEPQLTLPKYGDVLLLKNALYPIDAPKNPGSFNYQKFSSLKQIYFQTFIEANQYKTICDNCGYKIWSNIFNLRQHLVQVLKDNLTNQSALAIASALLLGQKDYLTPEIKEVYADTGAMHILAVSGLHVGILYFILAFLFKPLEKRKWGILVRAILITLIIWLYAAITGMSPSVTRASIMFSLYLLGSALLKDKNLYNIIACSAFVLLLFNPNLIAEVGFQLSYAAVFAIIYFQPKIYRLWFSSNRVINFFWNITAVSIAAQLGTFPISMFYFHQFPTHFILSNLVAIPSASIIFVLGLSLMFSSIFSSTLAFVIGKLLNGFILLVNFTLAGLSQLPLALIKPISISYIVPLLIFILIIGTCLWLIHKKRYGLILASMAFIGICSATSFQFLNYFKNDKLLIYYDKNDLTIDHIKAKKSKLYKLNSTISNAQSNYILQPSHIFFGSSNKNEIVVNEIDNLFFIANKCFLKYDPKLHSQKQKLPFKIDYLIVDNNPFLDTEFLNNGNDIKQVVITANNNFSSVNYWQSQLRAFDLPYYNIKNHGAFIVDL